MVNKQTLSFHFRLDVWHAMLKTKFLFALPEPCSALSKFLSDNRSVIEIHEIKAVGKLKTKQKIYCVILFNLDLHVDGYEES